MVDRIDKNGFDIDGMPISMGKEKQLDPTETIPFDFTTYAEDDVTRHGGNHPRSGRARVISPDIGIYPPGFDRAPHKDPPAREAVKSPDESFGLKMRVGMLDAEEAKQQFTGGVRSWHIHHYFNSQSEADLLENLELRDKVISTFPDLTVGKPFRVQRAPHPLGMWVLELHTPGQFTRYMPWLTTNRGNIAAEIHPNTVTGEYADHTDGSFWLGTKEQLDIIVPGVERLIKLMILKYPKVDRNAYVKFKSSASAPVALAGAASSKL